MTQRGGGNQKTPLWRDERFWQVTMQFVVLAAVIVLIAFLVNNLTSSLAQQGREFNFDFLTQQSNFNIGESLIPFSPEDPYYRALLVGLLNTLRLILVGFVLTTILGVVAGIISFSDNWLLRKLSQLYVELVRNTPLLLQLFVWYFAVIFGLAGDGDRPAQILNVFFVTKRQGGGFFMPWPPNTLQSWLLLGGVVVAMAIAILLWRWRTRVIETQGASGKPQLYGILAMLLVALVMVFGMGWRFPAPTGEGGVSGGLRLSLEYAAILGGLVFYTGAFIAEIVRAGIQSVSKGQWEAARALGLQPGSVMQLVVFPQALRVIIPSLNSQYMNLAKNSSLALAIGYPDIYSTASTTFNQTGRPVEVFLIIAGTYLLINLIISLVMNQLNKAVQLKER
jgi:general L-amino acid transport system permease protein